jgi:hypothetical protein
MRTVVAALALALAGVAGGAALAQARLTPAPAGPHVEDPRKLPEPAPSLPSLAYDSRVIASAASAEQFQGPLDGGWVVGTGTGDLYGLQLVDKRNVVEGAWRDLRRKGDPAASGVLDQVLRTATGLVVRFKPAGQQPVTVSLRPNFRGELSQGGKVIAVAMRKAE